MIHVFHRLSAIEVVREIPRRLFGISTYREVRIFPLIFHRPRRRLDLSSSLDYHESLRRRVYEMDTDKTIVVHVKGAFTKSGIYYC